MTKLALALVAHDNKKDEMIEWARFNKGMLSQFNLYATGTTGGILQREVGLDIHRLKSGPLGGDMQIGAKIAEGVIHCLIFFWDPLEAQPHDPDIKALLRLAVVWNIPLACNPATADYIISSHLWQDGYRPKTPDYTPHKKRMDDTQFKETKAVHNP